MKDTTDRVVELDLGIMPEAAISGGLLLQTDYSTFLTFNAVRENAEGLFDDVGHAIMEFIGCWCSQFGSPNDEAIEGHPLYSKGLDAYGIFEVLNSSWIKQLEQQNQVSFPDFYLSDYRHFIITFHDSTFECVARDFKLEVTEEPYAQVYARLAERVVTE